MAMVGELRSRVGWIIIHPIALKLAKTLFLGLGKYMKIGESEKWFEKHGAIVVLAGRMTPGVREIISIPAFISTTNIPRFILRFIYILWFSYFVCFLTLIGYCIGDCTYDLMMMMSICIFLPFKVIHIE
jgi:membrane protein DedA with SNARE-associated domain